MRDNLNTKQKNSLAFGAILFYYRGEEILGITPKGEIDSYMPGLKSAWGVYSKESAFERIQALIDLERSTEFDQQLKSQSPEVDKIRKRIAKELKIDIQEAQKVNSTYAWDLGRAVPLAKWSYWCGYLSEDEFWKLTNQATEKASQIGRGWTDYTVSFLLGRTMQGFDLDDIIVEAKQILKGKGPWLRKIKDIDVFVQYPFK